MESVPASIQVPEVKLGIHGTTGAVINEPKVMAVGKHDGSRRVRPVETRDHAGQAQQCSVSL
jgi:hypothetical protein